MYFHVSLLKPDYMKKEILAVILVTIFMLAVILGYGAVIVWVLQRLQLHLLLKVLIITGLGALAGTMIYVAIERIREIREEEKDDLSQY